MTSPEDAQNPVSESRPERVPRRGRHRVFIGMAPGVGKTYRMLEEAHRLRQEGIDVVIGLLETHNREETAKKAEGLEIIPRKQIDRGGLVLTEMDTDAIIDRRPQIVLVDELAHTNVPGSAREKRYQDVDVILAAGIDVLSTVNIQHLESLNDLVAKITGVIVRERIPDPFLDDADELVVVDVTPETLQERLLSGKIYAPDKIQQSIDNFFQRGNLIALRELALREVADNIEEDRHYTQDAHPPQILANGKGSKSNFCNIHETVLVCISTHPNSIRLIRRGARIASYMSARFYVLFISSPDRFLTKEESLHVETCEKLCHELGGKFLRESSHDIASKILEVANDQHVTQVVLGENHKSRWQSLLKEPLTHKLERSLLNVDLHIIAAEKSS